MVVIMIKLYLNVIRKRLIKDRKEMIALDGNKCTAIIFNFAPFFEVILQLKKLQLK